MAGAGGREPDKDIRGEGVVWSEHRSKRTNEEQRENNNFSADRRGVLPKKLPNDRRTASHRSPAGRDATGDGGGSVGGQWRHRHDARLS
jgi:hypothetical protein